MWWTRVDSVTTSEDEYVVVPDRTYTYADYVYDAEKLRTFSGKNTTKEESLKCFLRGNMKADMSLNF